MRLHLRVHHDYPIAHRRRHEKTFLRPCRCQGLPVMLRVMLRLWHYYNSML